LKPPESLTIPGAFWLLAMCTERAEGSIRRFRQAVSGGIGTRLAQSDRSPRGTGQPQCRSESRRRSPVVVVEEATPLSQDRCRTGSCRAVHGELSARVRNHSIGAARPTSLRSFFCPTAVLDGFDAGLGHGPGEVKDGDRTLALRRKGRAPRVDEEHVAAALDQRAVSHGVRNYRDRTAEC